jgi:hypothetical protein
MAITIRNPRGADSAVSLNQPVLLQALVVAPETSANLQWSSQVNGGASSVFASGSAQAVYTTPSAVVNADAAGNKGVDVLTITARDTVTLVSTTATLILVQGVPAINRTTVVASPTSGVSDPDPTPVCKPNPGGVADPSEPTSVVLMDEDNHTPDAEGAAHHHIDCVASMAERRGKKCGCSSPMGRGVAVAYPGGLDARIIRTWTNR